MGIGLQFESPEGYGSFRKGVRYYFGGDRSDGSVLMVWFAHQGRSWRVHLLMPSRSDFEAALTANPPKLRRASVQHHLPPWLAANEGMNFDDLEDRRYSSKKKTYREQVESRLFKITPALEHATEILDAKNPLKEIARTVAQCERPKSEHPHRLQVWFFAYFLHGQDLWALKQPTLAYTGTWSRSSDAHRNTKFGRPSLEGNCYGWPSAPMQDQILKSFLRLCSEGTPMTTIHRRALLEDFDCVPVVLNDVHTYVQPQNKAFPSYGQFRSVVVRELGIDQVQTALYGAPRMRLKAVVEEGNYTEQYANILEGFEVDAFYTERPTSIFSSEPSEKLSVARGVCVTTGAVVGIGFALGSETGEAYRSMLFCMAAPKDYIAWLYGIPADKLNWPMQGMPSNFISDRGPAGQKNLAERCERLFPIKTIVGSYSGQSKASVEASHPRDRKLEGGPSYLQSDLNVIEMVKREVFRAASDNHSSNITLRLSDQAIHDFRKQGRVATPHHYWQYLEALSRTCAYQISLEQAIRAFWIPFELTVNRYGIVYRSGHFSSAEFRASGIHKKLKLATDAKIKCYRLNLVLRCLWAEVDGRLIQVERIRTSRVDQQDLIVPDLELAKTQRERAALASDTRVSVGAASGKAESDFAAATGKGWHQGKRRLGKPKRVSVTSDHESQIIKGRTLRKDAA